MNLKKTLHHEGHRDHEDSLWGYMLMAIHPPRGRDFWGNPLYFFVPFVSFVVK